MSQKLECKLPDGIDLKVYDDILAPGLVHVAW